MRSAQHRGRARELHALPERASRIPARLSGPCTQRRDIRRPTTRHTTPHTTRLSLPHRRHRARCLRTRPQREQRCHQNHLARVHRPRLNHIPLHHASPVLLSPAPLSGVDAFFLPLPRCFARAGASTKPRLMHRTLAWPARVQNLLRFTDDRVQPPHLGRCEPPLGPPAPHRARGARRHRLRRQPVLKVPQRPPYRARDDPPHVPTPHRRVVAHHQRARGQPIHRRHVPPPRPLPPLTPLHHQPHLHQAPHMEVERIRRARNEHRQLRDGPGPRRLQSVHDLLPRGRRQRTHHRRVGQQEGCGPGPGHD